MRKGMGKSSSKYVLPPTRVLKGYCLILAIGHGEGTDTSRRQVPIQPWKQVVCSGSRACHLLSRDCCNMMLAEGDQWDPRSGVWIGAGDIGPLFEEFRSGGVNARLPPADYPWAHEIQIPDPREMFSGSAQSR